MFKATPESPRMFESDFIDFFSRTHYLVVPALFVPATSWLLWWCCAELTPVHGIGVAAATTAALFVGGFISWTLSEYWLHRTFFHWQPGGKLGERMHFLVHGVHHRWPKDKYRLVMPPAVSISLFWIMFAAFYLPLGVWGIGLHAGYTAGYMWYDLVHYWIHHGSPKTTWGRQLKKHHLLHHFKDHDRGYGVSWIFWDNVFGTNYPKTASGSLAGRGEASPAE